MDVYILFLTGLHSYMNLGVIVDPILSILEPTRPYKGWFYLDFTYKGSKPMSNKERNKWIGFIWIGLLLVSFLVLFLFLFLFCFSI